MTDTPSPPESPPDHLCANPKSPFYDEKLLERGVGVRFKGVDKTNVDALMTWSANPANK